MNPLRFSLSSSLVGLTLIALTLGAVTTQSAFLTDAIFTCFWVVLLIAVIGARSRQSERRRFWLGFALAGWTYWFIGFEAAPQRYSTLRGFTSTISISRLAATESPRFVSSDIIDWLEDRLATSRKVGSHVHAIWRRSSVYPGVIEDVNDQGDYLIRWDDGSPNQWTTRNEVFADSTRARVALHCLFGLCLSLVVGTLGAYCFRDDLSATAT